LTVRPDARESSLVLAVQAARPAAAAVEDDLPAPVSDSELDGMRGGFLFADGIEFNFGATTQTLVNGQLAFQTQVTWGATGAQVTQTLGASTIKGTVNTGQIQGLGLQGLSPNQIALLNNGATALIQTVTNGAVTNIVINQADGQTIQQQTQLNLQLAGFSQVQQAFQQNSAILHLLADTQTGLGSTLGR
jgi:hypothetical protein